MWHDVQKFQKHKHRYIIDADTREELCIECAKPKDKPEPKIGGNKYHNVPNEYNGRTYHSKKEAQYAQVLDILLKNGEIKSVTPQVKVELFSNGLHICNYWMDFEVITKHDVKEWHEVKGFETDTFKIKKKLLLAQFKDELEAGTLKYIIIK